MLEAVFGAEKSGDYVEFSIFLVRRLEQVATLVFVLRKRCGLSQHLLWQAA